MVPQIKETPKVSVAIVNWNTKDLLEACLESIFRETTAFPIEVIVADNDSRDGSCEMVKEKFKQVILIENKANVGFAKGTNQGFEIARGEYVLMLNSDTVILDRAIEKTVAFADAHPEAGGIGCRMTYPDGRFQSSCFRIPNVYGIIAESIYLSQVFKNSYLFNWNRYGNGDRHWSGYREVDCVMGSFILVRGSILKEVGFLDEDYFMYGEETDFCHRIKASGKKIYYYSDANIIHVHGGSQKSWADLAWSYGATNRGVLYFLYKWKRVSACIGNFVIAVMMLPRIAIWALLDFRDSLKAGVFEKKRILKGANFWFHLRAVFQPSAMHEKWRKT